MSSFQECRLDALEDAVYEKALSSAASDATARRKIEAAFSRLISVPSAAHSNRGHAPPAFVLPLKVFKRGLQVYLNGVEDKDLDALARRYLLHDGKNISVGHFLDGVFHVISDKQDDLMDQKHTKQTEEPSAPTQAVFVLPHQREKIVVNSEFWTGKSGNLATPEDRNLASQDGASFRKRLARFLLAFRRVVFRKAQEASQALPARRRLQKHVGELAERVSRRLLLEGFEELAALEGTKVNGSIQRSTNTKKMGISTTSSRKGDPKLSRNSFAQLLAAFRGPGFAGLGDADTTMLWRYVGEGSYSAFAQLVFTQEFHEERVAGRGRRGKGVDTNDAHTNALGSYDYALDGEASDAINNVGPIAELGFENGLIQGSRGAPTIPPVSGPFDRLRTGERLVVPPPKAKMPKSIKYPQSRTTVSPPSDMDPSLITRSGKLPREKMILSHALGFNGSLQAPALYATADSSIVFPVACVVVILDSETGRQRLFHGHDEHVTALALSDSGCDAASGQAGKDPYVLTWCTKTLELRQKLGVGFFEKGIVALSFSADASFLVTVGNPEHPYIGVWDSGSGMLMAEMSAAGGKSPPIWQILCQPQGGSLATLEYGNAPATEAGHDRSGISGRSVSRFVTVGNSSHVTFYSFDRRCVPLNFGGGGRNGVPLRRKIGTLNHFGPEPSAMTTSNGGRRKPSGGLVMHCVAFIGDRDNLVASGGSDGKVYLWKYGDPVGSFRADDGPITSMQVLAGDLYTGSAVGLVRKFETDGFSLVKTLTADGALRREVSIKPSMCQSCEAFQVNSPFFLDNMHRWHIWCNLFVCPFLPSTGRCTRSRNKRCI